MLSNLLLYIVVLHVWQSRARGSYPWRYFANATHKINVWSPQHGAQTQSKYRTGMRENNKEALACVLGTRLVFVEASAALPARPTPSRCACPPSHMEGPRVCALSLALMPFDVDINTGKTPMLLSFGLLFHLT